MKSASRWAERIYLHGDAIYVRSALLGKPIIRCLQDFIYEESLLSAFTLRADLTIVPSEYLRDCIRLTARPNEPVLTIHNSVSVPDVLPDSNPPKGIASKQPIDLVMFFPHRPDPRKGLADALRIAECTAYIMPHRRIRLVVAHFPTHLNLDGENMERTNVSMLARELAPSVLVETYDWLPEDALRSCYAFADITLCPGSFIESFGIIPLESIACGTPVIAAKVGGMREFRSIYGIRLFPHGTVREAAEAVPSVISDYDPHKGRAIVNSSYNHEEMLESYINAITGPLGDSLPSADERVSREKREDCMRLAPWCYTEGGRLWDDYASCWREDLPELSAITEGVYGELSHSQIMRIPSSEREVAIRDSVLVPCF